MAFHARNNARPGNFAVIDPNSPFSVSSLGAFAAEARRAVFEELVGGVAPTIGVYDAELLKEAQTRGLPQMGAFHYEPEALIAEFIFPDAAAGTTILSVSIPVPARIVYLPIPEWVIENIYQGEISGSYHFEHHAQTLREKFNEQLHPENNPALFNAETRIVKG